MGYKAISCSPHSAHYGGLGWWQNQRENGHSGEKLNVENKIATTGIHSAEP